MTPLDKYPNGITLLVRWAMYACGGLVATTHGFWSVVWFLVAFTLAVASNLVFTVARRTR